MKRLEVFQSYFFHPVQSKIVNKLSLKEHGMCVKFIEDNEGLSKNEFATKVNVWLLDKPKPKNFNDMWALVSSVNSAIKE